MEGITLLIVDDEEDLVSAMAERLMLRGFRVETATSGAEALSCLAERGFDLVLVDVKMPGIHGLAVLAEIKRKQPALPVILFTGHSSVADAEKGIQEGAFSYLMKPIEIERLIEEIRRAAGTGKGAKR